MFPLRRALCTKHWSITRLLHNAAQSVVDVQSDELVKVRQDVFAQPVDDAAIQKQAMRVTKAGAAVNITLAASKLFVGYTASSSALIADGVHSLSDLVSDFVTGIVLLSSRKPADADHPYGHGKFEAVGTLAISGLLLGASFGLALQSYTSILDVAQIWLADTAAAPSQSVAPNLGVAFGVAVVSVAAKEALYQWTHAVGVKARSQVLITNAWHHRTDALSSVVALIGIGGMFFGAPLADPVASMVVSAMIAKVGLQIGWQSVCELTDRTMDFDFVAQLEGLVASLHDQGALGYRRLRTRKMGHYVLVDLEVKTLPTISVSAALQVASAVRFNILRTHPEVGEVLVHVYSDDDTMPSLARKRLPSEIEADVRAVLTRFTGVRAVSHCRVHYIQDTVEVELAVDLDDQQMSLSHAYAQCKEIRRAVETIDGVDIADVHLETEDS